MKIKSATLIHECVSIVLRATESSAIAVRVSAFPLGIDTDFTEICPRPSAPVKVTNRAGQPPLRDANTEDPTYLADLGKWIVRRKVYHFWRVLQKDADVTFDIKPTSEVNIDALYNELKESGVTEADMLTVINASLEMTKVRDTGIQEEKTNF